SFSGWSSNGWRRARRSCPAICPTSKATCRSRSEESRREAEVDHRRTPGPYMAHIELSWLANEPSMAKPTQRAYSGASRDALTLLGQLIHAARVTRKL